LTPTGLLMEGDLTRNPVLGDGFSSSCKDLTGQTPLPASRPNELSLRPAKPTECAPRRCTLVPMASSSQAPLVRFGVFEVDLDAGELRRNGARIRLQEQPFQVLAALLERPGQVVTREDLRQKIWPADTFVDFDHSLNTAVNKIREALGDSASSPRFVETLARRGYRFIAPFNGVTATTPNEEVAGAVDEETALHPELHVPMPHRGLVRGLFALIQVMYLVFYLSALSHLRDIDRVTDSFLPGWGSTSIVIAVLVTGTIGIPLRFYLLSAVAFDFRKLGETFRRLFPFILALDQLWGIAPFLLLPDIGIGMAFAATGALLYVPFSERTLVRMAYQS
jgi:cholera toxin transcriptional activator